MKEERIKGDGVQKKKETKLKGNGDERNKKTNK
jgi:hypothetical protein